MGGVSGIAEYDCPQFVETGRFEQRLTSAFPGGFCFLSDRSVLREAAVWGSTGGYMGIGMLEVDCGDPPVPRCVPLSRVEARRPSAFPH